MRLPRSFQECSVQAPSTVRASTKCRLYWFPAATLLAARKQVHDAATFVQFLEFCHSSADPVLWVYDEDEAGKAGSSELESGVVTPRRSRGSAVSGTSSQKSGLQANFRAKVMARDGPACVLCRHAEQLEAAHVVRRDAPPQLVKEAFLADTWELSNGIMLCRRCHIFFDQHLWHVTADGTVQVAESVLASDVGITLVRCKDGVCINRRMLS